MSDGYTHDTLTTKIQLPISFLVSVAVYPTTGIIGSLIAFPLCYLGFSLQRICTPDADCNDGYYGLHLVRKNFGKIAWWLYSKYWLIYALAIPHRSWISHFPIISTFIRFIYLFWPIWVIFWVIFHINLGIWWDFWLYLLIGMVIADFSHIALDKVWWFREWFENRQVIKRRPPKINPNWPRRSR